MASEDAFIAAKSVFMLFYGYVGAVAREIGQEKAEALMAETCNFAGTMHGAMTKEQLGIKEPNAKTAWSMAKQAKDNLGADYEVIEESAQRVVTKNRRCPMYEAAHDLGMDAAAIEKRCLLGPMGFMAAAVKQLNPDMELRVRKFRSGPDDFCEEEISIP